MRSELNSLSRTLERYLRSCMLDTMQYRVVSCQDYQPDSNIDL